MPSETLGLIPLAGSHVSIVKVRRMEPSLIVCHLLPVRALLPALTCAEERASVLMNNFDEESSCY